MQRTKEDGHKQREIESEPSRKGEFTISISLVVSFHDSFYRPSKVNFSLFLFIDWRWLCNSRSRGTSLDLSILNIQ